MDKRRLLADMQCMPTSFIVNSHNIHTMLSFVTTMSLDEFKELKRATALEVRKNSRTGKYYFVCGDVHGAVSPKYISSQESDPVVSLVEPDDGGESFYLLHTVSPFFVFNE